jgi:hypothetical protein
MAVGRLSKKNGPRLSKKMWEVRKTLLFFHVASFIYRRSRPDSHLRCWNDGARIPVIGVIPYEAGSWIMLAWCPCCNAGFGQLSDPDYGWSDALTYWYDARNRCYRASLTDNARLSVRPIEDRLNDLIAKVENGVPSHLTSLTGYMDIEDAPEPVPPPDSLWDGWMEGFEPGALARTREWRR